MQSTTRYWLILLAIVSLGAVARSTVPVRPAVPDTQMLAGFPMQAGPYKVTRSEFSDSEKTRRTYAPAAIVYRDYSDGYGAPINLFIAPEIVGWDSPSICARYQGSTIIQRSVLPVANGSGLTATELVMRSSDGNRLNVCAYYWRGPNGVLNDDAVQLLKGKIAVLTGVSTFRVDMCTDVKAIYEIATASERLSDFASLVDPEVLRLLQRVAVTAVGERSIRGTLQSELHHH